MTRSFVSCCLTVLTLVVAGCSDESPTAPSTAATAVYTGTIDPLGSAFAQFTLGDTQTTRLTFASLTAPGSDMVDMTPLTLGVGTPGADSCVVSSAIVTSVALAAQTTISLGPGLHCVSLADPDGALAGTREYAIRLIAGDPDSTNTPGNETIILTLPRGGSASRPFTSTAPGTASLYLLLDTTEPVGLGIGVPRTDSSGCFVGASIVTTSADAVVSAAVDTGRYCVKLFDAGTLSSSFSVSMTLSRP